MLQNPESQQNFHVLIIQLLRFFRYTVSEETIQHEHMKVFYKGLLRVLLVLLHDWNDFLSEYVYIFI